MAKQQDALYASPLNEIIDFKFDEKVVAVFPDMIQRSVPGYANLISSIGVLAGRYVQPNSRCYDLGCSLGSVSLSMRQHIKQPQCDIIAVDNSKEMIERGKEIVALDPSPSVTITMQCKDITDTAINNASVVVLNFTLQFIDPARRQQLINDIYQGLNPGGILILSEKVSFNSSREDGFLTEAHHDFKRANGYSDLEISQKRTALEKVMIPESISCHQERLSDAGFDFSTVWFQCFNFVSLIAIK